MTRPETCPECDSLAYRNGQCSHCHYADPCDQRLPPWRERGLRGVRAAKQESLRVRGVPPEEESDE